MNTSLEIGIELVKDKGVGSCGKEVVNVEGDVDDVVGVGDRKYVDTRVRDG